MKCKYCGKEQEKKWGRSPGFTQSQAVKDKIAAGVRAAYEKRRAEKRKADDLVCAGLLSQE